MRTWLVIVAVIGIAWWWQRGDGVAPVRSTSSISTPDLGELIARLPTPAQLKLRPRYIIGGGLRLEGQTIDSDQQPVGGVTVTLNGTRSVTTETDGAFAFDHLAEAEYAITAEKELIYAEDTVSLGADSDPVELEMKIGVGVKIHVEATDHHPIRDAALEVNRRHALTDRDGNAFVRGLDLGRERLEVSAAGYGPQIVELATGDDPRAQLVQTVVLEPGAPLSGTVVDQDGVPAANATVSVSQAHFRDRVDADATGHFEVPLLGPGKVVVSASSDADLATPDVAFDHDGIHAKRDVVIHVTTGAVATGIVVDAAGTPVAEALVCVGTSVDRTDAHGRFALKGINPGLVDVTASTEQMAAVKRQVSIARGPAIELRIELVAGTIAGIVRDSAGQPVESAWVSADGKNDIGYGTAISDEYGKFDFGGLPPGEYEVTVKRSDDRGSSPKGVPVRTGTRNLSLTVAELGSIAGRVVANGVPVAYFGIAVSDDPDPSWASPDPVRATDGAFVEKSLRPGVYAIAVIGAFERKIIKNVRVGEGGVTQLGEIAVVAGKRLHGIVHDERGTPVAGARVAIGSSTSHLDEDALAGNADGTQTARTDAMGRFELAGFEGDTLYIQATRGHDMSVAREIATTEELVELVISGSGSLDGSVVNQRGRYTRVWARASDGTLYSESTNAVGEFHFERLPPGEYLVDQRGTATVPQHVQIDAGATAVVTLELPREAIAVTVAFAGCKRIHLESLEVYEAGEDCVNGAATFADVTPGTFKACADWDQCSEITVAPGPSSQQAVIQPKAPESEPEPDPAPAPAVEETADP